MGNPVAHSKSPLIHRHFAEQTGQKIHYQAILVATDGFAAAVAGFRLQGGRGLNVTLPFKGEAFAMTAQCSGRARRAAAVNTLWFDGDGSNHGDNTDGIGLLRDLRSNDIGITGQRLLILGAGGAVDGIICELLDQSPARLVVANRTRPRAKTLCDRHRLPGVELSAAGFPELAGQCFDLVINGTSAGLQGVMPPIPPDVLAPGACCYDLVYGPAAAPFTQWAVAGGASTVLDGIGMLVEQAAESFRIWHGVQPRTAGLIARLRQTG